MRARRIRRFLLLGAVLALAFPGSALAHARLLRSDPPAGAVLARAPAAVRIVFDDSVEVAGGNEIVSNAGGRSVLGGEPRVTGGGKVLVLPLPPKLANGDYSVRWRIVSDDGHLESGVLAFAVGQSRPTPLPVLRAAADSPSAGDVVFRWFLLAGIMLAAGTAGFAAFALGPALRTLPVGSREVAGRIGGARVTGILFAGLVLAAIGAANFVRGGPSTRFGAAMLAGLVVALLGAGLAIGAAARRALRLPAAICAVALLAVPSLAGHALDAGVPWPNVPVDMLHLAAAAAWVGALAGLVFVLPAANAAAGGGLAAPLVRRVSGIALGAVLLLGATGVVRAVFELRAFSQLWTTGYGRALLTKSGFLLLLVGLGWANRRRLDDALGIGRRVRAELVLLAGAVVAVAFLTGMRPGRSVVATGTPGSSLLAAPQLPPAGAVVFAGQSRQLAVALAVQPGRSTVTVLAPSGGAADGLDVSVAGTAAKPCGHGCYAADVELEPGPIRVLVNGHPNVFTLPAASRPANALVRRATKAFRAARSVSYAESLSSGQSVRVDTVWRLEAPNRIAYRIDGGPEAVVIGDERWDREPGEAWKRSETSPPTQPLPTWAGPVADAHVLSSNSDEVTISWLDRQIPAWFTVRFDRRTLLPRELEMIAAAHFMHQRYLTFGRPRAIFPPRSS